MTHLLNFADISIFHRKSANCAISRNTDINFFLIHNFHFFQKKFFFESLRIVLSNMVTIFMMPGKMATLDLLKITILKQHL